MRNYLDLVSNVIETGELVETRSGSCFKVFDRRLEYDLQNGFPIVTTKYIHFKSVVAELLWFLKGYTNTSWLEKNGVTIWNEWADVDGNLGPIYGHQWRNLCVDQIDALVNNLRNDPQSRRLLVSSWNVSQLHLMRLPPCHYAFECYVRKGRFLDLKWHQRSVDIALGLPFNISSYALLTHILAAEADLLPGKLIGDLGNCHIYTNHVDGLLTQLKREPRDLPQVCFDYRPFDEYEVSDFCLIGYRYHDKIPFEVAV